MFILSVQGNKIWLNFEKNKNMPCFLNQKSGNFLSRKQMFLVDLQEILFNKRLKNELYCQSSLK